MFIDMPVWLSIFLVLVLVAMAWWVFYEDGSPRPLGAFGVVLAGLTGLAWFTWLPFWTALVLILVAMALFVTGMLVGRKSTKKDNFWHYGALGIGIFGKMVCAFFPWLFGIMDGSLQVSKWVLALLLIAAVLGIGLGIVVASSSRVRGWVTYPFRWAHARAESREEAVAEPPAN